MTYILLKNKGIVHSVGNLKKSQITNYKYLFHTEFLHRLSLEFSCVLFASVGFTLSQATKALRESRGIAILYF